MKQYRLIMRCACVLGLMSIVAGCGSADPQVSSQQQPAQAITTKVTRGSLIATVSNHGSIEQASSFAITLSQRGNYLPLVKVGDMVKAHQILGYSNGKPIVSPVDARVRAVNSAMSDIPAYYPVMELEYQGFAITIDASLLTSSSREGELNGVFQVDEGVGPSKCLAVVNQSESVGSSSALDDGKSQENKSESTLSDHASQSGQMDTSVHAKPEYMTCLIPKNLRVRAGQNAIVVLKARKKENVLLLPLSSVAGRMQRGSVTKIDHGERRIVEVELGISDGAHVEITSGLREGDEVVDQAPDLRPAR